MNTQTKIFLISAHHNPDVHDVSNILTMVANNMLPAHISDIMNAYMVASDWVKWIKDPDSSDDSPLKGKTAKDVAGLLELFQRITDDLASELQSRKWEVVPVFRSLNPCLIDNWRSQDDLTREMTKMFHRSLRLTAKLFAEYGDNSFNEMLEEKQVPTMS